MNNKVVELLAPAGDWDSFVAAVENGAHALYLGGKLFSARQFAANFDQENLKKAIRYAHLRGVKVYLTMNTLIGDSEINKGVEFLNDACSLGIDGLIVQDLGFAKIVRDMFPHLCLHASTQMTTYNLEGVKLLESLGFKRAVLARELSIEEIRHIAENTSMEIEVFVHGAMCISYSGQCLMSSIIGGRSGNRGTCAQPCRLPYELCKGESRETVAQKAYLLSPKDMSYLNHIDELVGAGIKSLKIEGRMKSPEYVATVVRIYRKYIDYIAGKCIKHERHIKINKKSSCEVTINPSCEDIIFYRDGFMEVDSKDISLSSTGKVPIHNKDLLHITQIFNRGGFTNGYLKGKNFKDMISFQKPKNWGIYVGEVISYDKNLKSVKFKALEELTIGDGIEVWNGEAESPGTIVTSIKENGINVNKAKKGHVYDLGYIKGDIDKGCKVYRTSSKVLNDMARESFNGKYKRKVYLEGWLSIEEGIPASFKVQDEKGNKAEVKGTLIVQKAINKPLDGERVLEQIKKTGQTPFEFRKINIHLENNLSVPISEINNIRRLALDAIEKEILKETNYEDNLSGKFPDKENFPGNIEEKITKLTYFPGNSRNLEKKAGLSGFFYRVPGNVDLSKLDRVYIPFKPNWQSEIDNINKNCLLGNVEVFIYFPSITRGNYDKLIKNEYENIKNRVKDGDVKGILAGNTGTINLFKSMEELKIWGDYTLNIYNSFSMGVLKDLGLSGGVISPELTFNQIRDMENIQEILKEAIVYGRIPLMTSEYCPVGGMTEGEHLPNSEDKYAHSEKSLGKCTGTCEKDVFYLRDRMGMEFPVICDRIDCRSTILNSNVLLLVDSFEKLKKSGIDLFRLNFYHENDKDIEDIINIHWNLLNDKAIQGKYNKIISDIKDGGFTKGHYFRGV